MRNVMVAGGERSRQDGVTGGSTIDKGPIAGARLSCQSTPSGARA